MIFFTSDTHFGHSNIIRYCGRPFATKEEHDQALIDNWNAVVQPGDTVYHLGDFGFGDSAYLRKLAGKLRGQINLIRGNHDTNLSQMADRFGFIKDTHLLKTKINDTPLAIFLSHYPHRTWPHRPRNAYHLYGHVHNNMEPYGLSFDVGVDCWNYAPLSLLQVHTYIQTALLPAWNIEKERHNSKNVKIENL